MGLPSERWHSHFVGELATGHQIQVAVAERLREEGLRVHVPELRAAPTAAQRRDFADDGDLHVYQRDRRVVVEAKSRALAFSEHGQDFPYVRALVDRKESFDAKDPKPVAYVLVSQQTGAMTVAPVSTRSTWTVQDPRDGRRGYRYRAYTVHRSLLVPLDDLIDWLLYGP